MGRGLQRFAASALGALLFTAPAHAAEPPAPDPAPTAPPQTAPPNGRAQAVEAILDQPGVLTEKGHWVLEPSLQFSNSADARVAILGVTVIPAFALGSFEVREVDHDSLIGALTARYGITNRLEVETKIPYVYRQDRTTSRPVGTSSTADEVFEADGSGLGDIELALRYQLTQGLVSPVYIASLRVKTRTGTDPFEVEIDPVTGLEKELPTGSGFIGIQPGITMMQVSDPAVFSATFSYLWHLKRDVGNGYGEIDPADMATFNVGMGLGLNERASFSLGYEHNVVGETTQNGETISTSEITHVGTLLIGASYRISPRTSFTFSLGAGLTDAAPDVQVTLRLPMRF